ncbi:hypothetical protein N9L68_04040 [bacterium]|nr:hypothetical protein [bacterium]
MDLRLNGSLKNHGQPRPREGKGALMPKPALMSLHDGVALRAHAIPVLDGHRVNRLEGASSCSKIRASMALDKPQN